MKYLVAFLLIGLFACRQTAKTEEKVSENPALVEVQYAKHFRFVTTERETVLEILNPDSKKVMCQLVPFKENKGVIALSGTFIGMMNQLGLVENIVGVSETKYVYNPEVLKGYKAGNVLECGYDSQMKIELMMAKRPAAIFHSGYNKDFAHQKQFENVGIQVIPIYDWREESPLGKVEWIKVYGFLFGMDDKAIAYFENVVTSYNDIKKVAQDLKPSELLMSGNLIGGEWCAPAGESFIAQIMKDANISYSDANSKGTGSVMSTLEEMYLKNRHAKYWMNPGAKNLKTLSQDNPKAVLFDAFQNKQVYCYLNDDTFFWEESAVSPHLLLRDYIHISHPELGKQDDLHFYKRLQ